MYLSKILLVLLRKLSEQYLKANKFDMQSVSSVLNEALQPAGIGVVNDHKQNGEQLALNYIKSKVDRNPVVFDVGANSGNYSLLIMNSMPEANIHAFEPLKETFTLLSHNCNVPHIHVYNFGFSDENKSRLIYFNLNNLLPSLYHRDLRHLNMSLSQSESIDLKTLDSFCAETKITKIDFLKIDIEGHEFYALKGAEKLIMNNCIRFIQFEFGGCNIDSRIFFRDLYYLLNERYKLYRIHPKGLTAISSYSENLEQYMTTNYLAELKI